MSDEKQTETPVDGVEDVDQSEMETSSAAPVEEDSNVDGETPMEDSTTEGGKFSVGGCFIFDFNTWHSISLSFFLFFFF